MELGLDSDICAASIATTVAILELSVLVRQIGTAVTPLFIEASGSIFGIFILYFRYHGANISVFVTSNSLNKSSGSVVSPLYHLSSAQPIDSSDQ